MLAAGRRTRQRIHLARPTGMCDGARLTRSGTRWKCHALARKSHARVASQLWSSEETELQACQSREHPSKATGRSGPGPAAGLGCPGAVPAPPDSLAVPCLSFPSSLWARSHHPRPSRGVLGTGFMRLAVVGQGGCPPGCTFGLNPGVPLCTDTSKNNRPERSANRRLFIALHP